MSTNPEIPVWNQGEEGLGSAKYFGKYLKALRGYYEQEVTPWTTSAAIHEERYIRLEHGEENTPPTIDEINDWSRGWNLTREEIIDLKLSGGYDVSAYLEPLTEDDILGTLRAIDEYNRNMSFFDRARLYFDVGRALVGAYIDSIRPRHSK